MSSVTGDGIDDLKETLSTLVGEVTERGIGNFFRLPIDRVFIMKGFGTVVTGTTVSGQIKTGEEVTVYPQGIASKIRGIQVHSSETDVVRAGLRTAINLQGVEASDIEHNIRSSIVLIGMGITIFGSCWSMERIAVLEI